MLNHSPNPLVITPEQFVFAQNNQLKTTSLKVSEAFGKLHKDILRKIETLECSNDFNERNFTPVEYSDAKGEKRSAYEITKDGFMFLVMGFTGKKAAAVKEAYIAAFNRRGVAIFAKAFMGIPAQQAAKTTRPLMPAAAPAVLVTRSLPNKG